MIDIDIILKAKGLTKTDVAKRMELSRESLYRILSGNPTLENLNKLANALEIPVSELFEQPTKDTFNCPHCGGKIHIEKS